MQGCRVVVVVLVVVLGCARRHEGKGVIAWLLLEHPSCPASCRAVGQACLCCCDGTSLCTGTVLVRLEALGALRGLATNYPGLLCTRWGALSRLADHALQATTSSPRIWAGTGLATPGLTRLCTLNIASGCPSGPHLQLQRTLQCQACVGSWLHVAAGHRCSVKVCRSACHLSI